VLITGGAGFIGSNLVRRLQSLRSHVRVVDNLTRGTNDRLEPNERTEFIQMDLTDAAACRPIFEGMDVVFHLASKVGAISYYVKKPLEVLSTNMRIDSAVVAAAQAARVPRFMYASSVFVYPAERQTSPDSPPLREEDCFPANPPISYGWAKVVGEKLAEYASTEGAHFRVAILRLMGVYGPGQDFDLDRGSIIPVLVRRAIEYPRLPFVIRGSGQESRAYCFVDDVIDAMLRAVEKLSEWPLLGPLNVGSERGIRIVDLAREIVAVSGKQIEIQFVPGITTVRGQSIDCSAARLFLDGWTPQVPFCDGLAKTFADVSERLGVLMWEERTKTAKEAAG
jgi:nucleoside-diphosphate-sugar epimerase